MARSDVTGVLTGRGRSGVRGAHGGQTTCRPDERAATHEPRREAWARFSLTASEGTGVGGSRISHPKLCLFGILIILSWLFLRKAQEEPLTSSPPSS